jgi:CHAT domain-containing protein
MTYRTLPMMMICIVSYCLHSFSECRPISVIAQAPLDRASLVPASPVRDRLRKGEAHRYPLALPAGQFAEVEAKALSGDISLELRSPDGNKLMKMSARNGVPGGCSVIVVAENNATYSLLISALDPEKGEIDYEVQLTESRPAEATDQARCQGESLYAAGEENSHREVKEGYLAALENFRASLPFYEQAQDWFGMARAIGRMGVAFYDLSDYRESLTHFEKALETLRKAKPTPKSLSLEGKLSNNIGAIAASQYDNQKALTHYLQALAVNRQLKERYAESIALANIGDIYTTTGQPEDALQWYEASLAIENELHSEETIASLHNSRGTANYFLGKYDKAIDEQQASLVLWRKLTNPGKQGWTLANIAANHIALNHPQPALKILLEAMPLIKTSGDQRHEAFALHCLGDAHRLLNQYDQAFDYYQEAIKLRQEKNERIQEAYTVSKVAEMEIQRGNLDEALLQSDRALTLVDQVRRHYSNPMLGAAYTSSTHHYYAETLALLLKLHKQKPDAGYDVKAFQTSERAHARSFLESLSGYGGEARAGVSAALTQRESEIQKTIDRALNERAAIRKSTPSSSRNEELATLQHELRQRMTEVDALQGKIRDAHPSVLRPRPLDPTEIQRELLTPDTVLLEYFVAQDRIYLFAVPGETARPLQMIEIGDLKTIEKHADFFRRLKFETPAEMAKRFSYQNPKFAQTVEVLSEKLLSPVKSLLSKRKIWIVTDGALQQIPFGALPDPFQASSNPRNPRAASAFLNPMMMGHEIAFLPSASTAAWLRKATAARPAATRGVAVIADPIFSFGDSRVKGGPLKVEPITAAQRLRNAPDLIEAFRAVGGVEEDLPRLPGSAREAEAIARLSPGKNLIASGFDANRILVMSGSLQDYSVLHFGTHAFVDDAFPGLSYLALSRIDRNGQTLTGDLRLNDIYQLQLNADLVVLGACRTGLGKKLHGEGMIGLSRGFIYAGAPQILVSLWDVPDLHTARFMERFYRNLLKAKLPAVDALRAAQMETWKDAETNAPFFWAAFCLQGDPKK